MEWQIDAMIGAVGLGVPAMDRLIIWSKFGPAVKVKTNPKPLGACACMAAHVSPRVSMVLAYVGDRPRLYRLWSDLSFIGTF